MPYASKKRQLEYQRNWMAKRREEWFRGKVCVRCGSTDSLELDHIDPATKVAHAVWSWSEQRRTAELAKCQALCRDCHQRKSVVDLVTTYGVKLVEHGTSKRYDRGCRCRPCTTAKSARVLECRQRRRARLAASQ